MGSYSVSSRQHSARTGGSSSSTYSDASDRSKSTAPTVCSERPTSKRRENIDPKDSVSTYASTSHDDELPKKPRYEVVTRGAESDIFPSDAIPSNSSTFGKLFPSSRRLLIGHDDTTLDGNMNLRVHTLAPRRDGYQQAVILFHLRMYDLYSREFSFRRYCRNSEREVCHSARRPISSGGPNKRPGFQRSLSSALAGLRPGSSGDHSTHSSKRKRQDLGQKSAKEEEEDDDFDVQDSRNQPLADTVMLEFSNYAHVEIKRRGAGLSKRYEFEYWCTRYQWRREHRRDGDLQEVAFHLIDLRTSKTIAHLIPEILTPMEAVEEQAKGGWVPPSSMWISEDSVYEKMPDVADMIVVTGLMVLVDDSIRRRWHSRKHGQLMFPVRSSLTRSMEFMGPRRLLSEVFHRRGSA
ncbi:hypothetical protein BDV38DRAFT_180194 [Aspergillus pseudotamarii]|uniref:Uncharacterized protein n=1 Tax=Aspergillus pseudotamarii TaxID=132259 RepID=A0A5N6SGH1_ASPPS|nr:uncharacterized protein BDV38DRAFT_180194 [Aspergillus pseudotamarii]KAE8133725.1 hypothetical protein BDV38DRAFT_180194 [Aspergillus pseudotamarii]